MGGDPWAERIILYTYYTAVMAKKYNVSLLVIADSYVVLSQNSPKLNVICLSVPVYTYMSRTATTLCCCVKNWQIVVETPRPTSHHHHNPPPTSHHAAADHKFAGLHGALRKFVLLYKYLLLFSRFQVINHGGSKTRIRGETDCRSSRDETICQQSHPVALVSEKASIARNFDSSSMDKTSCAVQYSCRQWFLCVNASSLFKLVLRLGLIGSWKRYRYLYHSFFGSYDWVLSNPMNRNVLHCSLWFGLWLCVCRQIYFALTRKKTIEQKTCVAPVIIFHHRFVLLRLVIFQLDES
jgi:hypothetical protein